MIKDQTIDEALIEIMRTKKALEALRKARKIDGIALAYLNEDVNAMRPIPEHAAAKRASTDLTRVLAKLRAGK